MATRRRRVLAAVLVTALSVAPAARSRADEVWDKEPKGVNPATGGPANAPSGCCCIPKLHPTSSDAFDCRAHTVQFDCTAQCAQLKDGRDPSGCKWTAGDCPK